MTPVQTLLSTQTPRQPGPIAFSRNAATNLAVPQGVGFPSFVQGGFVHSQDYNALATEGANAAGFGGGCGVASGLAFASSAGLALHVASGVALCPGGFAYLDEATDVVLPDNSVSFVWIELGGALYATTATTLPPLGAVYLGAATTASGAVTTVDYGGRVTLGGLPTRATADLGYPLDSPAFPMLGRTKAGTFLWDGSAWRAIGTPTCVLAIAATLALSSSSAPRQVLDPGSATVKVLLPAARVPDGVLEIHHGGAAGTLQVRDAGDSTTIATLTSGQRAALYPSFAPSGAAYPSATLV